MVQMSEKQGNKKVSTKQGAREQAAFSNKGEQDHLPGQVVVGKTSPCLFGTYDEHFRDSEGSYAPLYRVAKLILPPSLYLTWSAFVHFQIDELPPYATYKQLSDYTNKTERTVELNVQKLRDSGYLYTRHAFRDGCYVVEKCFDGLYEAVIDYLQWEKSPFYVPPLREYFVIDQRDLILCQFLIYFNNYRKLIYSKRPGPKRKKAVTEKKVFSEGSFRELLSFLEEGTSSEQPPLVVKLAEHEANEQVLVKVESFSCQQEYSQTSEEVQDICERSEDLNICENPEESNIDENPEESDISEKAEERNIDERFEESNIDERFEESDLNEKPEEPDICEGAEEVQEVYENAEEPNIDERSEELNIDERPEKLDICESSEELKEVCESFEEPNIDERSEEVQEVCARSEELNIDEKAEELKTVCEKSEESNSDERSEELQEVHERFQEPIFHVQIKEKYIFSEDFNNQPYVYNNRGPIHWIMLLTLKWQYRYFYEKRAKWQKKEPSRDLSSLHRLMKRRLAHLVPSPYYNGERKQAIRLEGRRLMLVLEMRKKKEEKEKLLKGIQAWERVKTEYDIKFLPLRQSKETIMEQIKVVDEQLNSIFKKIRRLDFEYLDLLDTVTLRARYKERKFFKKNKYSRYENPQHKYPEREREASFPLYRPLFSTRYFFYYCKVLLPNYKVIMPDSNEWILEALKKVTEPGKEERQREEKSQIVEMEREEKSQIVEMEREEKSQVVEMEKEMNQNREPEKSPRRENQQVERRQREESEETYRRREQWALEDMQPRSLPPYRPPEQTYEQPSARPSNAAYSQNERVNARHNQPKPQPGVQKVPERSWTYPHELMADIRDRTAHQVVSPNPIGGVREQQENSEVTSQVPVENNSARQQSLPETYAPEKGKNRGGRNTKRQDAREKQEPKQEPKKEIKEQPVQRRERKSPKSQVEHNTHPKEDSTRLPAIDPIKSDSKKSLPVAQAPQGEKEDCGYEVTRELLNAQENLKQRQKSGKLDDGFVSNGFDGLRKTLEGRREKTRGKREARSQKDSESAS